MTTHLLLLYAQQHHAQIAQGVALILGCLSAHATALLTHVRAPNRIKAGVATAAAVVAGVVASLGWAPGQPWYDWVKAIFLAVVASQSSYLLRAVNGVAWLQTKGLAIGANAVPGLTDPVPPQPVAYTTTVAGVPATLTAPLVPAPPVPPAAPPAPDGGFSSIAVMAQVAALCIAFGLVRFALGASDWLALAFLACGVVMALVSADRLRWHLAWKSLRDSEIRWVGVHVQWVVSPVQISLWTHMHKPGQPYRWRFNWNPIRRIRC